MTEISLAQVASNALANRPLDARWSIDKEDHYQCALAVLEYCREVPGTAVIFDEGEFWVYRLGTWNKIDRREMRRSILRMSQWADWSDGTPIKMNKGKIGSILELAEVEASAEGYFSVREGAASGIAFEDCFVRAGVDGLSVHAHTPDQRARHQQPFPWDPNAECPQWRRFLDSVFDGDRDSEQKQRFLAQFIGSCLTGVATDHNRALMLYGTGSNGKSVLCDVIEALFPPDSITCVSPQDMHRQERISSLVGAQLNLVSDIPLRDMRDPGGLKQIVAGDMVAARRLYENSFRFRPTAGHIFSCNRLPMVGDSSFGFFRRWAILTFNREFSGERQTPRAELVANLMSERQGIMRWALEGAVELMSKKRFFLPESSEAMIAEWRQQSDQSVAFLAERCIVMAERPTRTNPGVKVGDLYAAYTKWADANGHGRLSQRELMQRLRMHKIESRRLGGGVEVFLQLRSEFTAYSPGLEDREDEL